MIAKDGQTTITANIPMAGFRFTGIGSGASSRTQSANTGDVQDGAALLIGTIAGTANAITGNLTPAITAYAAGQTFRFIPASTNTSATTIAINGLASPKNIFANGAACSGAEIRIGVPIEIIYDGTQFNIIGQNWRVPVMFSSGAQAAAAGGTLYIGLGSGANTESNAAIFPSPFAGTLRNLRMQAGSAPGVGETFTYTLRKNTADTALTATTSGGSASASNDVTHSVSVTAGDILSLKVVTSSGAAVTYHTAACELDVT